MDRDSFYNSSNAIKRGDVVWFSSDVYGFDNTYTRDGETVKSSVQGGHRPWVVVSNDLNNKYSPTIVVVPCTTETKNPIPVHVKTYFNNRAQTILCEQPRVIDKDAIDEAITHLSPEVMDRVDTAIALQMGLITPKEARQGSFIDAIKLKLRNLVVRVLLQGLDEEEDNLLYKDAILKNRNATRNSDVHRDEYEEEYKREKVTVVPTPENVINTVDDIINDWEQEQQKRTVDKASEYVTTTNTAPVKTKQPMKTNDTTRISKVTGKPVRKRQVWTVQSTLEFLEDYKTMPLSEVTKKYGFKNNQTTVCTRAQREGFLCKNGYHYEKTTGNWEK